MKKTNIITVFLILAFVSSIHATNPYEQNKPFRNDKSSGDSIVSAILPSITTSPSTDVSYGEYIFAISPWLFIINRFGSPVYINKAGGGVRNFRYHSNGYLSYYDNERKKFFVLDDYYNTVDSIEAAGSYDIDFHDMKILENGHILLLAYDNRHVDMSEIITGGSNDATVRDMIIQELDNEKNLIFQWFTGDNLKITDADTTLVDLHSDFIDYAHVNSVYLDSDSNLLLSFRNMSEIIKINRETGGIIWRFGGAKNEFTIVDDYRIFSAQHSVSRTKSGNLLFFDNGNGSENEFSRVVEYSMDTVDKTSTLIREIRHDPDIYTPVMGNVKELESGNVLVGWGKNGERILATEYNNEGEVVNELILPENSAYWSYHVDQFFWRSSLFPTSIDTLLFGSVEEGDSSISSFSVYNNSSSIVHIDSFYLSDEESFELITDLPVSISPGENQSVEIKFKPLTVDNFECILTSLVVPNDTSRFLAAGKQVVMKGQGTGASGKEEATIDKPSVIVYPNPFSDVIHIDLSKPAVSIVLTSINGKILWEGTASGQTDIPADGLKKGAYLLSLYLEDGTRETITIVKD